MIRNEPAAPLPVTLAHELRDALGRRQKELPDRWLAAIDAAVLDEQTPVSGAWSGGAERTLLRAIIRGSEPPLEPRGIVCIRPSASAATPDVLDALCATAPVSALAVAELDRTLAVAMLDRLAPTMESLTSAALACDCTVDLPLPNGFPHPRVYLCLGNVLGSVSTVGAVRMLRVVRSTMRPGDALVLGVDSGAGSGACAADTRHADGEVRHRRALASVVAAADGELDASVFEFRPVVDVEARRTETHLVARRAMQLDVPGVGTVRFRKGESIRTSVRCAFDRGRLAAMLAGVGLSARSWIVEPDAGLAAVIAGPAT